MTLSLPMVPWEVVVRRRPPRSNRVSLRGAMAMVAVAAVLTWAGLLVWRLDDRRAAFGHAVFKHDQRAREASFSLTSISTTVEHAEVDAEDLLAEADWSDDPKLAANLRARAADRLKSAANFRPMIAAADGRRAHHRRLEAKYRRAADYPLLPVWPDSTSP